MDDFLARGEAVLALTSIVSQASATLVGIGMVIEKAFQDGGAKVRSAGAEVFSLVRIKGLISQTIEFVD